MHIFKRCLVILKSRSFWHLLDIFTLKKIDFTKILIRYFTIVYFNIFIGRLNLQNLFIIQWKTNHSNYINLTLYFLLLRTIIFWSEKPIKWIVWKEITNKLYFKLSRESSVTFQRCLGTFLRCHVTSQRSFFVKFLLYEFRQTYLSLHFAIPFLVS